MDPSKDIAVELLPLLRTFKDGRIERLYGSNDFVPPSLDPATVVTSKDVLIDPHTHLSARLFLPDLASLGPSQKLPVLVYFHGGGFCAQSPFSSLYHNFVNSLVAEAKVIAVSVNYRLAPEHPLPAAYEDAARALQWVASHAEGPGPEPWLAERGEISRVFLAGDSAGANIAHNMAMRAKARIEGLVLIHPHFWGSERLGCEKDRADKPFLEAEMLDRLWPFAWGSVVESDDPQVNPMADGAPSLAGLGCGRVLVAVAERDVLRDRGRAYCKALRGSGWRGVVELLETEEEDHVFHLLNPCCDKAVEMMARLAGFLRE
ncbi:Tuliposide A-converting enzyme b3, amyloplastic [Cocos nucifera]|uniref:Tuliposide A-converting enzyme b3, amyloplastic n=1 Tax=Cocos nucifera TaxID=13894 RepID=A0A8K0MYB2_COCNU|nr:Tuliposide A-converting enzyme b3, amyloplastic [Cocos nucifera]